MYKIHRKEINLSDITMQLGIVVVLLSVFWNADLTDGRYLQIKWEGEVEVPLAKGKFGTPTPGRKWWGKVKKNDAMIVMQTRPKHIVQLDFSDIAPGTEIKVYVTRSFQTKGWRLRRRFVNVTEASFKTDGKRGIRIIANARSKFTLHYFRGFCPVPDSVTSHSCTRKKEKGSRCDFQCRSPESFSIQEPQSAFKMKCKVDRSWMGDIGKYCITKEDVEKNCLDALSEEDTCPLSSEQLIAVYSEQKRATDTPRSILNFLSLTLRGRYTQYSWQLPQPTAEPGDDRRFLTSDCFDFCIRNSRSLQYVTSCGNQPTSPTDLATLCLMCRYGYWICDQHAIVA